MKRFFQRAEKQKKRILVQLKLFFLIGPFFRGWPEEKGGEFLTHSSGDRSSGDQMGTLYVTGRLRKEVLRNETTKTRVVPVSCEVLQTLWIVGLGLVVVGLKNGGRTSLRSLGPLLVGTERHRRVPKWRRDGPFVRIEETEENFRNREKGREHV